MKILIGVDDTPSARAALDYVRSQAWPSGTRALLVSSHQPDSIVYTESYSEPRETMDEVFDHDADSTRHLVSDLAHELRDQGLETETRVVTGDPREAIVDAAKDDHVDLIVLGSRDRSGMSRLFHGSVASHVVAHAPCNVLVVKLPTAA